MLYTMETASKYFTPTEYRVYIVYNVKYDLVRGFDSCEFKDEQEKKAFYKSQIEKGFLPNTNDIQPAEADAQRMKNFFEKILKIPSKNIKMIKDASKKQIVNIDNEISDLMEEVSESETRKLNLWFYYNGHGVSNDTIKMLLNEKLNMKRFHEIQYKFLNLSREFKNVYIVTMYDCCRQKVSQEAMKNVDAPADKQIQDKNMNILQYFTTIPEKTVSVNSKFSSVIITMLEKYLQEKQGILKLPNALQMINGQLGLADQSNLICQKLRIDTNTLSCQESIDKNQQKQLQQESQPSALAQIQQKESDEQVAQQLKNQLNVQEQIQNQNLPISFQETQRLEQKVQNKDLEETKEIDLIYPDPKPFELIQQDSTQIRQSIHSQNESYLEPQTSPKHLVFPINRCSRLLQKQGCSSKCKIFTIICALLAAPIIFVSFYFRKELQDTELEQRKEIDTIQQEGSQTLKIVYKPDLTWFTSGDLNPSDNIPFSFPAQNEVSTYYQSLQDAHSIPLLKEIKASETGYYQNYILSNGQKTEFHTFRTMYSMKLDQNITPVKKIDLIADRFWVKGMVFYDGQNNTIGQFGTINSTHKTTIDLQANEKILGVRGKLHSEGYHVIVELQLIVGQFIN